MRKQLSFINIIALIALIVVCVFVFSACKDGKLTGQMLDDVLERSSLDKDDLKAVGEGYVTVDDEGNKLIVGVKAWPTGKAAQLLPELKSGKIQTSLDGDKSCAVSLSDITQAVFDTYLAQIKAKGFVNDTFETTSGGQYMFSAVAAKGQEVTCVYDKEAKTLAVSATID